ncbi:serine/threonine-protein kinase pim-1-like isoform X3 [Scophthalmus maximus]|nr:serine/threonine-protein kinase pim-1-like isoform X3 [Scophthalmus maximus]
MKRHSLKTTDPCCPAALRRNQVDRSCSTTVHSASPAKGSRTRRKAGPEKETVRKRRRVFKVVEPSEKDGRVEGKRRENGEGQPKKAAKLHYNQCDKESASRATDSDTDREGNSQVVVAEVEDMTHSHPKVQCAGEGQSAEKRTCLKLKETRETVDVQRANFKAKYKKQRKLGEGGCGSVFAGYRKEDNLPVAIKHIPEKNITRKPVGPNGKMMPMEVAIMLKLAGRKKGSVGASAPVSLLDWYDLGQELILVLERPFPSEDLSTYIFENGGSLQEKEAMDILKQLVDAAIGLQDRKVFHRDIKSENILIEMSSSVQRVRLIDFGLSCIVKKNSVYRTFSGTQYHTPPEWCSCSTYRAGPTTVWQLGIVLYEMLHLDTLFETKSFLNDELEISSELTTDCKDFLQLCLETVPQQRPTLMKLKHHPWLQ